MALGRGSASQIFWLVHQEMCLDLRASTALFPSSNISLRSSRKLTPMA